MKNDKDPHEVEDASWAMVFAMMVIACIIGTGVSEFIVWVMR